MKVTSAVGVAVLFLAGSAIAAAAEVESGIPVGGNIGTYRQTKCSGNDGFGKEGDSFCYTWVLGGRPVVFIFAKTPDEQLASLVSKLDTLVANNKSQKLAAVVNFTGAPSDDYLESIKTLGENAPNVALSITSDAGKFKVNDEAEVTVMHYKGKKVAFNAAVATGELDEATIKKIVDGAASILQ